MRPCPLAIRLLAQPGWNPAFRRASYFAPKASLPPSRTESRSHLTAGRLPSASPVAVWPENGFACSFTHPAPIPAFPQPSSPAAGERFRRPARSASPQLALLRPAWARGLVPAWLVPLVGGCRGAAPAQPRPLAWLDVPLGERSRLQNGSIYFMNE